MNSEAKKPSLFFFLTEGIRGAWDRFKSRKFRRNCEDLEKGDGHPVLVIPGLFGNDSSTKSLRTTLETLNYKVYGWDLGINLANLDDVKALDKRLHTIYDKHKQKVSVIGWSLGGLYSRKISLDNLDKVRQVITLGSPYRSLDVKGAAMLALKVLHRSKDFVVPADHKDWLEKLKEPLPIQTTSLYSKKDGIVPWMLCKESIEDDLHQSIEIGSSHTSMLYNLNAIKAIIASLRKH